MLDTSQHSDGGSSRLLQTSSRLSQTSSRLSQTSSRLSQTSALGSACIHPLPSSSCAVGGEKGLNPKHLTPGSVITCRCYFTGHVGDHLAATLTVAAAGPYSHPDCGSGCLVHAHLQSCVGPKCPRVLAHLQSCVEPFVHECLDGSVE